MNKAAALAAAVTLLSFACSGEERATPAAAIDVTLVAAELQTVARLQPYAGTIRAAAVSSLSSRIMGDVVAVHVSAGDRVQRGQLLIEIDDRDAASQLARAVAEQRSIAGAIDSASAAVRSAEAQAALAERTWQRFRPLRDRGSVSAQEYDEVETRHRSAYAELERARQMLAQMTAQRDAAAAAARQAATYSAYTRIVAPFDGVISARLVDPGTQAAPGMALLAIDGGSRYRAEATVGEAVVIAPGDEVSVESGAISVRGRVTHVVPSVDPATRTALVKVELPQHAAWRSGAFARLLLPAGEHQAVTIPASAIMRRGQLTTVYAVAHDGLTQLRLINVAGETGDRIEVLSGIAAGERVVAHPAATMREGVRVAGAGT
ncbi:MAG TPA: efflux RND transporter periplasmic adaptor subunit [Thermoanaerobaculia bacterium]|nr:efflux RND transporter periplasmic adaptor subunit [Thermoanaerobaculia bacterium]